MMAERRKTRRLMVGKVAVGGDAPLSVQTMAKADPHDAEALRRQIVAAADLGCDIMRLAVPDQKAAAVFKEVRRESPLPLVADVHFDYRLALAALGAGADGLRINPGNIGGSGKVKAVVAAARERMVPIRIGVNGGSLERDILEKHGAATAEALVERDRKSVV